MLHFHFNLSHLAEATQQPLTVKIRGNSYPLLPHAADTLRGAAAANQAVAQLGQSQPGLLTHFAELPQTLFPKDRLTRLQVVGNLAEGAPANSLPPLHHVSFHTHQEAYVKYLRRLRQKLAGNLNPCLLHTYGLAPDDHALLWQVLEDEYQVLTPVQTAIYVAGQHPLLSNSQPPTHLALVHEHIYPKVFTSPDAATQCNNIIFLAKSIAEQGTKPGPDSGFATVQQAVDGNGVPMTYGFTVGDQREGDPVLIYSLTEETNLSVGPAAALPVQTSRNDPQFKNQTWAVNQGEATRDVANQPTARQLATRARRPGPAARQAGELAAAPGTWTVSPNTSTHGITVDDGSIQLVDGKFSVDAYNSFLRIVGAYVEFFGDQNMTQPLDGRAYVNNTIPDAFQTNEKRYLAMVSSVNTIMGIPFPTDPTALEMRWPKEAQAARLMFGGVGTWNYDAHTVWPGFIETGIFCFGIPIMMMAAQTAVTDTAWYKEFIKDSEKVNRAIKAAIVAGGAAFTVDVVAIQGLKSSLYTFGDIIAGILVSKGMEALSVKVVARITASQFAEAAPFVGWAMRVASVALNLAELAVSLGEVLSSPAVIEVNIKRQMGLQFTLHPDPAHGEPNDPKSAIWPAVADHYRIMVNYKNGTGFEAKGQVPLTPSGGSSSQPVRVSFTVPWGGQLQVVAAVYSANGWLCGKYQSDWLDAVPDAATPGTKSTEGNITELLVPLTPDTQYTFLQKIGYSADKAHHWLGAKAGATIPTATQSSLDPSPTGNHLSALSGITINRSASVLGYTWRGSGENVPLEGGTAPDAGQQYVFQNLSVLAEPEKRAKFPAFGFGTRPGLAYDLYGGGPTQVGPLNFAIDTRHAATGYLRAVDLLDGSPTFNLDSGLSYGTFSLDGIDAVAVHPSGYVVAVNWAAHKMQLLRLPEQAVPDASAPAAVVVSSKGVQQGLLQGPIALAISPDGKIYVLESLNNRVQAFDLCGNPAPSFAGPELFTQANATGLVPELDQQTLPADLLAAFLSHGVADLFTLPASLGASLDQGVLTMALVDAFADNQVYLAYLSTNGTITPDPAQTSFITVLAAGSRWTITDPTRNYVYYLTTGADGAMLVQDQFSHTEVLVLQKGRSWQLKDLVGGNSYLLTLDGTSLQVVRYLSYFATNPFTEQLNYLDLAIESKGYVYVLGYTGDPTVGSIPNTAYVLDVYTPQGEHLFRSPDAKLTPLADMQYVAAGRITVDLWRNMFALNYETLAGPDGRTEPSISQWVPTPPLFDLDQSANNIAMFNQGDMGRIRPLFAGFGCPLSDKATCQVGQPSEHWRVLDNATPAQYDVVTTTDKIEVYKVLV